MSKPDVNELIIEYFKTDILNQKPAVTPEIRKLILETFTYAHKKNSHIRVIIRELKGSELSQIRDRIIRRMESDNNPFPIRFGELKPLIRDESFDCGRSFSGQVLSIVRDHYKLKQLGITADGIKRKRRITLRSHNQLAIFPNWLEQHATAAVT